MAGGVGDNTFDVVENISNLDTFVGRAVEGKTNEDGLGVGITIAVGQSTGTVESSDSPVTTDPDVSGGGVEAQCNGFGDADILSNHALPEVDAVLGVESGVPGADEAGSIGASVGITVVKDGVLEVGRLDSGGTEDGGGVDIAGRLAHDADGVGELGEEDVVVGFTVLGDHGISDVDDVSSANGGVRSNVDGVGALRSGTSCDLGRRRGDILDVEAEGAGGSYQTLDIVDGLVPVGRDECRAIDLSNGGCGSN